MFIRVNSRCAHQCAGSGGVLSPHHSRCREMEFLVGTADLSGRLTRRGRMRDLARPVTPPKQLWNITQYARAVGGATSLRHRGEHWQMIAAPCSNAVSMVARAIERRQKRFDRAQAPVPGGLGDPQGSAKGGSENTSWTIDMARSYLDVESGLTAASRNVGRGES
jgi:hypothetical protein